MEAFTRIRNFARMITMPTKPSLNLDRSGWCRLFFAGVLLPMFSPARNLDAVVGIGWAECKGIAEAALHASAYVYDVTRNGAGTVLYINCGLTNQSRMDVVVTTTNVSARPSWHNVSHTASGEPHHWLDPVSKDWVFASGVRYTSTDSGFHAASPDSTLLAIGKRHLGIVCKSGESTNVLLTITNLFEVAHVDGDINQFYVVAIDRPGPRISYSIFSCSRRPSGDYEVKEQVVTWANNTFDLDGATGQVIFGERTRLFPAYFEVDSKTETKRKLNFATQFMLYVHHDLAQQLKRLNSKVQIQER
jgi:hypothetical protein